MKIINAAEFNEYWKTSSMHTEDESVQKTVKDIIQAVRDQGDSAVRHYASLWDKSSPEKLEVPVQAMHEAVRDLETSDPGLFSALKFSAENIQRFSLKQREQLRDFEFENVPGIFTGQKVIPVERAAVYIPGGLFPLISSALMCLVPAICAGVRELCFASPPAEDGFPDRRILAAAGTAMQICGQKETGFRIFSIGGAQAIAALALGTETIPCCDVISGPGNKYVAAAKRMLFGVTGIDLIAGPSDILVIADKETSLELAAADMLAQAEHDPDARARALVPDRKSAMRLAEILEERFDNFSAQNINGKTARASMDSGGLIIVYDDFDEAVRIANSMAPEHLELHISAAQSRISCFNNYGSLFIGGSSAEVLGDYSAGLNHTLPTLGSARFTGGLSVRHFLKTVTTLRCENTEGYTAALQAAETIARAEGLEGHAKSARIRLPEKITPINLPM